MLRNTPLRLAFLAVGTLLGYPAQTRAAPPADKPSRNIIFVICDQETYQLTARDDFKLPARQALMRHGVTFRNHYIASAMCSASRAAFLTGQPPQVTGVCDQMQYSYQRAHTQYGLMPVCTDVLGRPQLAAQAA